MLRIEELKVEYRAATALLDEEYERLSPTEQKAFRDKWGPQIQMAYEGMTLPMPW